MAQSNAEKKRRDRDRSMSQVSPENHGVVQAHVLQHQCKGNAPGTQASAAHVVGDPKTGRLRFLTPLQCERFNGFDDGWTEELPRRWRDFTTGNALVVPVVTRISETLCHWIREHES